MTGTNKVDGDVLYDHDVNKLTSHADLGIALAGLAETYYLNPSLTMPTTGNPKFANLVAVTTIDTTNTTGAWTTTNGFYPYASVVVGTLYDAHNDLG